MNEEVSYTDEDWEINFLEKRKILCFVIRWISIRMTIWYDILL